MFHRNDLYISSFAQLSWVLGRLRSFFRFHKGSVKRRRLIVSEAMPCLRGVRAHHSHLLTDSSFSLAQKEHARTRCAEFPLRVKRILAAGEKNLAARIKSFRCENSGYMLRVVIAGGNCHPLQLLWR